MSYELQTLLSTAALQHLHNSFPAIKAYIPAGHPRHLRMAVDWWGFAYAAALALGGFMGYKRKGSVVSLIAGLFFGSVSAYGAFRISNDPQDYWTSLMSAGVLAVVMGMRFRKSGKLMPAGIMAALSLLMVFRILIF